MDPAHIEKLMRDAASGDPAVAPAATLQVKEISKSPGFLQFLIELFSRNIQSDFGLWCSITLKSHILHYWDPDGDVDILSPQDRQRVRETLLTMLLACPPRQKSQVIHAIGIVSSTDYPAQWPTLLDELLRLIKDDPHHNVVIFEAIATVLYKFRSGLDKTEDNMLLLQTIHTAILAPLQDLTDRIVADVVAKVETIHSGHTCLTTVLRDTVHGVDINALKAQLQCLVWIYEIFLSLHTIDLSAFVESNMARCFTPMFNLLQLPSFNIPCDMPDYEGSCLDAIHSLVIQVISLFANNYEEDFQPLVLDAVSLVWMILCARDNSHRYDALMCSCLSLFASLSRKHFYQSFFDEGKLTGLINQVVVMHAPAREDDIDAVVDDPSYLERELISTANESVSKRGAVMQLIASLCELFEERIVTLIGAQINQFTAAYKTNPITHWTSIETAFFLFVSIGLKTNSNAHAHFPVAQYLGEHVVTLLNQYTQTSAPSPLLVLSALKALQIYGKHIPSEVHLQMLQVLFHYIRSDEHVIASYSAYAVSTFVGAGGIVSTAITTNCATDLIKELINALNLHEENQYILAAVITTIGAAPQKALPIASDLASTMLQLLQKSMKNQTNQRYIYLLFELLGIVLRIVIGYTVPESKQATLAQLEAFLFPSFNSIVSNPELVDMHTYVFTIMAMFLEERATTIPDLYVGLWDELLKAELWKTSTNIPSLVRFINAFLHNNVFMGQDVLGVSSNEINRNALLGIYSKLLASQKTYYHAFTLSQGIAAYTNIFTTNLLAVLKLHFAQFTQHKDNNYIRQYCTWLYSFWVVSNTLSPTAHPITPASPWVTEVSGLLPSTDEMAFPLKASSFESLQILFTTMQSIAPSVQAAVLHRVWPTALSTCDTFIDKKLFFRASAIVFLYMAQTQPQQPEAVYTTWAQELVRYAASLSKAQEVQLTTAPTPEQHPKSHDVAARAAHAIEARNTQKPDVVLRCTLQQNSYNVIDIIAILNQIKNLPQFQSVMPHLKSLFPQL